MTTGILEKGSNFVNPFELREKIYSYNRIYLMLSKIENSIEKAVGTPDIFRLLCRTAVETGFLKMAWAGLIDPKTNLLGLVESYGYDEGYLDKILDPCFDNGPVTISFIKKNYYICNDLEQISGEPLWKSEGLKRGYRSLSSFPLKIESRIVGTFNLFSDKSFFF